MKAEIIDIGRFIKVPYDLIISKISPRAFQVWTRIAADASPENPFAQVHQRSLANELGCCTQTIGRAIAELVRNNLLLEAGKWEHGRCKIYQLNWNRALRKSKVSSPLPKAQMEIPLESYIAVGAKAATKPETTCAEPVKPESLSVANDPNAQSDEEYEWIVAQIQRENALKRQKEEIEAKLKASYGGRGRGLVPKPILPDLPICEENYPIMWGFLRIRWADRRKELAA